LKTQEQQLEILFCKPKGLSFRETARRLGCDPRTAKKYIERPDLIGKKRQSPPRPSLVDPYRNQIAVYLDDVYANHRATWIHDQLVKSGYTGGYELVKRVVRQVKGRQQQLAFIRFETTPGAQAQVDFGEFMVTLPDGTVKTYYLFAMILGYSRKLFACLLERCDLPSFLEAHILAFEHFGGVPQEILYDRMRNVYIRDICDTVDPETAWHGAGKPVFTQSLLTLAVHYGFAPKVAPAYAPWVKGKIERPMDFVRESWWRGYEFTNLAAANRDLGEWLALKDQRVHGTTHERVDVRFEREKPHLQALPPLRCDVSLRLSRKVRKDCTISVEANRFIVPHTLVGHDLTVRLKDKDLRIFADGALIVEYVMPESKGHLVGLEKGFYEALQADRELQERKFGNRNGSKKQKGRARFKKTISPTFPPHPVMVTPVAANLGALCVEVEHRSIGVYALLSGEVAYAG
jgi:transposase